MIKFFFISSIFLLFFIGTVNSINIEGVVRDAQTGELLIGANVFLKNDKSNGTTTGLDGSFVLKNAKAGNSILVCSFISYQTIQKEISVPSSGVQKIALNLVSFQNELNDVMVIASNKTTDVGVRAFLCMRSHS